MSSNEWTGAVTAVAGDRLWRELDELAQFSDVPAPAVTRIVFSEADRHARQFGKVWLGNAQCFALSFAPHVQACSHLSLIALL